jgi:hypothetical protein
VVEHLNSDNFRGARQALGDLAVLAARFYSAARVVVREHDARRARPDGRLEDLPRVNKGGRERADRDCRELYDFVLGVLEHGDEVLPVQIGDPPPQEPIHVRGG